MKQEIIEQNTNVPTVSEAATVMEMIVRAAGDNTDVAKLEKLMDLQERILDRNAKQAFSSDFVRMKPHLPKILRTKDNTQTSSKYAPLEEINTQIDPVLNQYGFATATKIVNQTDRSVTVKAELWHTQGHVEDTELTVPLDDMGIKGTVNKTLPHAVASSVTYAKRLAICALLNISTGNDADGNKVSNETIPIDVAADLDLMIIQVTANKDLFLKYMGVDDVRNIRLADKQKAYNALSAKAAENKKNAQKTEPKIEESKQ